MPFHPITGDLTLIRNIKSALADTNLQVLDIYSFYLRPETNINDFIPAIELGAELGAKFAVVMGDDIDWSRMSENLCRICEEATRVGLICALEFAVMRPLASLAQTINLISLSGCKDAVVCLDPLNLFRAGEQPHDLIGIDPIFFPYAQISDGIKGFDDNLAKLGHMAPNQRCLLGKGEVPMSALLDALPSGLPLSIELPMPKDSQYLTDTWAELVVRNVREFLVQYYDSKK